MGNFRFKSACIICVSEIKAENAFVIRVMFSYILGIPSEYLGLIWRKFTKHEIWLCQLVIVNVRKEFCPLPAIHPGYNPYVKSNDF